MMRTAVFTILVAAAMALPAAAQSTAAGAREAARERAEAAREREAKQREKDRERERAIMRERIAVRQQQRVHEPREEQVEQFTRSVKIGPNGALDLHNMSGSVIITRGGGNEARIDAVKKARAKTVEEAREMLGLVQVEIAERGGRVEVQTRYPHHERGTPQKHRNVHVSVSYTIVAPAGTRLTLKTMSGDISVSDMAGDLSAESMSGNLRIERAARLLVAKTMSGDVTVVDAKSDGGIDAGTVSGEVSLRQVRARSINVGCVSGTITLADVQFERVDANSTSGDVIYQGALSRNGRYSLKTHSGNVRMTLDGNTGFQVDASTFSGGVRSDFAVSGASASAAAHSTVGATQVVRRQRTLHGVHGDGSAVLNLSTFSGNITLTKR